MLYLPFAEILPANVKKSALSGLGLLVLLGLGCKGCVNRLWLKQGVNCVELNPVSAVICTASHIAYLSSKNE